MVFIDVWNFDRRLNTLGNTIEDNNQVERYGHYASDPSGEENKEYEELPEEMELSNEMRALVAYAPGDFRLEYVETPRAEEGEMIVKIEACGICAGDLKSYHGA